MTHGSRTLSYGELWDQIQALSSAYRSLGIVAGNRVVCQLPTSPEHLTLLLRELDPRRHRVASLRWIVSAAAPLSPGAIEGVFSAGSSCRSSNR